ncbi:hypothetical protein PQX77_002937 [Marasmius sp. AFHP31]|nr:hypothetical protein PQX77_002937 [Marasmius sp. AFHP31]
MAKTKTKKHLEATEAEKTIRNLEKNLDTLIKERGLKTRQPSRVKQTRTSGVVIEILDENDDERPVKAIISEHQKKLQSKAGRGKMIPARSNQLTVSGGGLAATQNANVPIKIDLCVADGGDSIRRKFKNAMKAYPLFIGQRPGLSDMAGITVYARDQCNCAGWQRNFEEVICAHSHTRQSSGRNLLYLPGCTVFVDEQRPVVFAPKTQEKPEWRFSLRSLFDSLYGKDVELFFDNGPTSDDRIFYAGKYRCHRLNTLHPAGFIYSHGRIPWTLPGAVLDSQEPGYGQRLRMKDAYDSISAEVVIYEFMGLQCVGFDAALYGDLTGDKSWIADRSIVAKTAKNLPEVNNTKKRRTHGHDGESNDDGEDGTASVKKRKITNQSQTRSKGGSSSRTS